MSNLYFSAETVSIETIRKLFKEVYVTNIDEKTIDIINVKHIGSNKSKIFIAVMGSDKDIISGDERTLLQKILAAVKLSEEDVFIAALNATEPIAFNNFISLNKFEKLFFFGITPAQLGWHIEMLPYQKMRFMEKDILFVESLDVIKTNEQSKKKLWAQLQTIFSLK